MLWVVFRKVLARAGAEEVMVQLSTLRWGWVVAAVGMQLVAIGFSMVRWQRLLSGQGIFAPWRFLAGSILIARFWGAFTPGGFTGFGGWRIYDVAKHTGKTARATATIGVEMVLGQLAFGVVVMASSVFGFRFLGLSGVLLVNGFFLGVIAVGLTFLARPRFFRVVARWLPSNFEPKVRTLVDAVCAYQGKGMLVAQAALLGVGTHAFNNLIYVCAARALGVKLGVGEVFFGSSLQILATLIPASINGIGLREAAAVQLYSRLGMPITIAVLIPVVGFACEMFVSAFGGLIFVARRSDYRPAIRVADPDREQQSVAEVPEVSDRELPRPLRGLTLGISAGLIAGTLVGLGEAAAIAASGGGQTGLQVWLYGPVAYAALVTLLSGGFGFALALSGVWMRRAATPEPLAYARMAGMWVAALGFALTAFRIRRDVFHEELVWKSLPGLGLLAGCALGAAAAYWTLSALLGFVAQRRTRHWLLAPWGSAALAVVVVGVGLGAAVAMGQGEVNSGSAHSGSAANAKASGRPASGDKSPGNVLFIVIDTLRADHLPAYGYTAGRTPHLDAFAHDAVRFDQAFANASWTRPSFASMLTGRLPSSHSVMAKSDTLPDELTTLPEALKSSGYATFGLVTNFNVGPYFNFHQGFDEYRYLEPEFVLGADDASAKLLMLQFVRQRIERLRASRGTVEPGAAYQDATTVNRALGAWLDKRAANAKPFFAFVGYMDPHDPYFEHPYSGSGYARAAHPHPDPSEASRLRALYDGEISFWDQEFGALLRDLKRRQLYDDLTIVVTSDHGEEFGEHGGFWHGTTLYDEQVRVPLFIKLPQNRRGGTVARQWVQSIDLMPTVLEEAGLAVPKGVQGKSVFDPEGAAVVYAEESHEGNVLESVRERRDSPAAGVAGEFKLITANAGNPRGLEPVELYRVDNDPAEQKNLSSDDQKTTEAVMATLIQSRKGAAASAAKGTSVSIDEVADQLEALGYMNGEDGKKEP